MLDPDPYQTNTDKKTVDAVCGIYCTISSSEFGSACKPEIVDHEAVVSFRDMVVLSREMRCLVTEVA